MLVVIFGLEQLTRGKMRDSKKTMSEGINSGHEFDPRETYSQCSPKFRTTVSIPRVRENELCVLCSLIVLDGQL